ncbi:MAG: glycoside hydrolase family 9 protein, partial [bacterium]
ISARALGGGEFSITNGYYNPGSDANTWYFVDFVIPVEWRNIPFSGFVISGPGVQHNRWVDNIKVTNVRLNAGKGTPPTAPLDHIAASQIGYGPTMHKEFTSPVDFSSFVIKRISDSVTVFTGGASTRSLSSNLLGVVPPTVFMGDFSSFTTPGRYKIVVGSLESYPFDIGTDVFDEPVRAAQRMLYFQRSFTDVSMPYAEGPWVHGSTAPVAPPGIEGGWHEAGNYPVQITVVTQTIQHLLSAWEDFRPMSDATNIPESGNGVPDILDEVRWGLRSVLTMQDTSGGFWTTVCPNNGDDNYPYGATRPEDLTAFVKLLVATPATAKAIAVLAYASVVYREFDQPFAAQCLAAAQRGWAWLQNHPEATWDAYPCIAYRMESDGTSMATERMWAAAGMLYATGDPQYNAVFESNYVDITWIPSYNLTHAYAARLYLRSPAGLQSRKAIILSQMSNMSVGAINAGASHPFGASILYYWGSLNNALQSSGNYSWKTFLDDRSRTADMNQAMESVHYVFGRNILTFCYVSGLSRTTHGRQEGFDHWLKAIHVTPYSFPGILSGGPNQAPDQYDHSWPPGSYGYFGDPRYPRDGNTPIDGRFTDNDSWSTNEHTIGWNAVLAYNLYAAQAVAKNQFLGNINPYSRANVKVLLAGAYNPATGLMATSLKAMGILAAHFGAIPIPTNAVDSINIEIRNASSAAASGIRMYQPAWLLSDGTIRSFADTSKAYVEFPTPAGNYYLVVRHRNHLPIMSAPAQSLSPATPAAYDFTNSQSSAFGVNPMQQVGSKFALYSGDANNSGNVSLSDANAVLGQLNVPGYFSNDINLSGIVSSADVNIIFGNINKTSQVP